MVALLKELNHLHTVCRIVMQRANGFQNKRKKGKCLLHLRNLQRFLIFCTIIRFKESKETLLSRFVVVTYKKISVSDKIEDLGAGSSILSFLELNI